MNRRGFLRGLLSTVAVGAFVDSAALLKAALDDVRFEYSGFYTLIPLGSLSSIDPIAVIDYDILHAGMNAQFAKV